LDTLSPAAGIFENESRRWNPKWHLFTLGIDYRVTKVERNRVVLTQIERMSKGHGLIPSWLCVADVVDGLIMVGAALVLVEAEARVTAERR
jgi:hypothetical protein